MTLHPPNNHQDSKLTRILADAVGGGGSTALIGTISPAGCCLSETYSTLTFAARCMSVQVPVVRHEHVDYANLCAK